MSFLDIGNPEKLVRGELRCDQLTPRMEAALRAALLVLEQSEADPEFVTTPEGRSQRDAAFDELWAANESGAPTKDGIVSFSRPISEMITSASQALSKLVMPHDVRAWKTTYKKISVPATIEKIQAGLDRLALLSDEVEAGR